jgi:hypothetical protein
MPNEIRKDMYENLLEFKEDVHVQLKETEKEYK